MSERLPLVIDEQLAVDEPWNTGLRELVEGRPEIYSQLSPSTDVSESQKQFFFDTGRVANPNLRPLHLDPAAVRQHADQLRDWRAHFAEFSALPDNIYEAYARRIDESIANQTMLGAAIQGDSDGFRVQNELVYGDVDTAMHAAVADWFRSGAAEALESSDRHIADAGRRVLDLVPDLRGDKQLLIPSDELFDAVREDHWREGGHFALLFAGVTLPEKGPVKPDVGEPILEQVRRNLAASHYEITNAAGTVWSVSHHPAQLRRPSKYSMPLARFVGLGPGHEWSHVLERINGDRQQVRLLGFGLDGYENGNEGRAVVREQVAFPSFEKFSQQLRWQDILRRHLAVSLTEGDPRDRRDFVGAFAVMNAVDRLWAFQKAKDDDTVDAITKKADDRTWSLLAGRIFRGTEGRVAYRKDAVYAAGNVAVWAAVAEQGPGIITKGDAAKIDITNPHHMALMDAYAVYSEGVAA